MKILISIELNLTAQDVAPEPAPRERTESPLDYVVVGASGRGRRVTVREVVEAIRSRRITASSVLEAALGISRDQAYAALRRATRMGFVQKNKGEGYVPTARSLELLAGEESGQSSRPPCVLLERLPQVDVVAAADPVRQVFNRRTGTVRVTTSPAARAPRAGTLAETHKAPSTPTTHKRVGRAPDANGRAS